MNKIKPRSKAIIYKRYPLSSVLIYNLVTFFHFFLGGIGIILGYGFSTIATIVGLLYLAFAFAEMYLLMPLTVCRNCVYFRLKDSLCVSGMNLVSKRIAKQGDLKNFPNRAEGLLCSNNLYMASLLFPIITMIPALIINFTYSMLWIFIIVVILLLLRFFVIFTKIACVHCAAKYRCPQAESMGVREM